MKKHLNFLTIALIALFTCTLVQDIHAQDPCKKYRKGKFVLKSAAGPDTHIKRTKKYQIETLESGEKSKLKITWVTDCTYTLEEIVEDGGKRLMPQGTIATCEMKCDEDKCTVLITMNVSQGKAIEAELYKE